MKKFILIPAVVLILGVILWLGANMLGISSSIEVVNPTKGLAVQAVYATGTVEATVMMPIAPRVAARLVKLNVDEGSNVKKGQVLAQLEDEDLQNALRQLKSQAEFAQKTYDRNASLVTGGNVSKAEYDRSLSELKADKAAIAKAQAEADFMKLTAPADGLIIKRDGEIGQLLPANQPLFWLSCCAPMRISAEVDEEDIAQVQPGQKVLIRADAFPGKVFKGKVQSITPKGDPVARSYRVRVEFTETHPLQIGMTAETNIIIRETDNALLLPASAVDHGKIWLIKEGKLAQAEIKIGTKGQNEIEVIGGIAPGDMVVLNPTPKLKEGHKIHSKLVQWSKP